MRLVPTRFSWLVVAGATCIVSSMPIADLKAQVGSTNGLSTSQIAKRAMPATVTVVAISASGDTLGLGSGFLIQSDGVVVTNYHVLAGASTAIVTLGTRESFQRVRVINADSALDIAILRIPSVGLPFLPPVASVPDVGDRVTVIGNPLGLRQTVTDGIVSATRVIDGRALVQISAPISHGSSGGPVIDGRGRAFAIATSYLEGGQQLNFATPLRYALGLLAQTQQERSVGEVFAGTGPKTAAVGLSASSALPPAASRPRLEIGGTYWITQRWRGDGPLKNSYDEGLLIASGPVGVLALAPFKAGKKVGSTNIFFVEEFRTNAAGQVVLKSGGVTYDGYQTDKGVALIGKLASRDEAYSLDVLGERFLLDLSENSGLYNAEVRTSYEGERGYVSPDPIDWSGPVAIGFANDTVYVDLFLENAKGGSVALTGWAPLREHEYFRITSRDGQKSLEGSVEDGTLRGDWIDRRSGGTFSGTLIGHRQ